MKAQLQKLSFSSAIMQRGFWLYVWKITANDGRTFFYVGRTGDSSSQNAQSPFSRVSGHLGSNKHSNTLRRRLKDHGVPIESCRSFDFLAFGPIFDESKSKDIYLKRRDKIAALEKALCDELKVKFGNQVLNSVNCTKRREPKSWALVRRAFDSFIKQSLLP